MPRRLNPDRPRALRWKGERNRPSRAKSRTRDPDRFNRTKGMSLAQKIEHYTDKSGGPDACWPWRGPFFTGTGPANRYPQVCHGDKRMRANRVVVELRTGRPIPRGKLACHTCDNPPCVNPDHLFVGDHGDNARDRNAKGRAASRKGSRNGRAKLTEERVIAARRRLLAGERLTHLAAEYGVHRSQMSSAIQGKTWANVPDYLPEIARRYGHASV